MAKPNKRNAQTDERSENYRLKLRYRVLISQDGTDLVERQGLLLGVPEGRQHGCGCTVRSQRERAQTWGSAFIGVRVG